MKCPHCWTDKAYLRTYHGWLEVALGCLAFRPMKCNHCYQRFMVHWVLTIGRRVVPPVLRVTGRVSVPSHQDHSRDTPRDTSVSPVSRRAA